MTHPADNVDQAPAATYPDLSTDEEQTEIALDAALAPSMRSARSPQKAFNRLPIAVRVGFACLFAGFGGYLLHLTFIPLPWLLGALFFSAALSMSGFSLQIPVFIRQFGQSVAGVSVGVFFTPEVGRQVLELGWVMIVGGVASILVSVALSVPLARIGGCDRRSAFFAMMPGGLAEMAGLAHQFGANITVVSVSQSLRVIIIVMTVPAALTLYMQHAARGSFQHPPTMSALMLVGSVALALLISAGLNRLRVFNAFLLGGLAVGIALGLLADAPVSAPPYARIVAQLAIGVALGARFHWLTLRQSGARFVPTTIAATLALILANVVIAGAMSAYVTFPMAVLAASPGGIAEMSLTAESLGLAPPIVVAWHLVRIVLVALLTGPLFRLCDRRM